MLEIVARAVAVGDAALPADHMFVFLAARWATVFSLQHMSQIVSIGGIKKNKKPVYHATYLRVFWLISS